jgi:hypothetical protein
LFGENGRRPVSLDVFFEDADGYLLVRVAGEWIADTLRQKLRDIADEAVKRGYTRILMDAR